MGVRAIAITHDTGRPGSRVYLAGHRYHHGMAGITAAAPAGLYLAAHRHDVPWLALAALAVGVAAMWDDRHDFPWLSDRDRYTFRRR